MDVTWPLRTIGCTRSVIYIQPKMVEQCVLALRIACQNFHSINARWYGMEQRMQKSIKRHGISRPQSQSGFTLIEIVLVVMLIGVVVAFAASRILGGGDRAKVGLAKAQIQTTADKIEQYKMDVGRYPAALEDLVKAPTGSSGWLGPYAKEIELKDPWGQPMEYKVPGENERAFSLLSHGRDGKPGGSSVDADIASE